MKIMSLNDAESFVDSHNKLSWDGWTIIQDIQDSDAEYRNDGVYNRETGKWYRRIQYPYIDGTGWELPDSLTKR